MVRSERHPWNACPPIDLQSAAIVTDFRFSHPSKQNSPIDSSPLWNTTVSNALHSENAA